MKYLWPSKPYRCPFVKRVVSVDFGGSRVSRREPLVGHRSLKDTTSCGVCMADMDLSRHHLEHPILSEM